MQRRDMPKEFPREAAALRVAEVQRRWGVSEGTARRWYTEAGIRPRRPRPDERPARRPRVRRAAEDTQEMIRACLRCTERDCRGTCAKILALGG